MWSRASVECEQQRTGAFAFACEMRIYLSACAHSLCVGWAFVLRWMRLRFALNASSFCVRCAFVLRWMRVRFALNARLLCVGGAFILRRMRVCGVHRSGRRCSSRWEYYLFSHSLLVSADSCAWTSWLSSLPFWPGLPAWECPPGRTAASGPSGVDTQWPHHEGASLHPKDWDKNSCWTSRDRHANGRFRARLIGRVSLALSFQHAQENVLHLWCAFSIWICSKAHYNDQFIPADRKHI